MNSDEKEFYIPLAVYGGIILAGLLVSIVLLMIGLNKNWFKKKKTIIKEIYEQKNQNGKAKGGAQGHY